VKAIRLAVAAALLGQAGAVVAGAQVFAWASMLASGQSASDTFDGRHPCRVCITVQDAASGPQLKPAAAPSLDWSAAGPLEPFLDSVPSLFPFESAESLRDAFVSSDAPPPRSLLS
jgi:hypothetical protein